MTFGKFTEALSDLNQTLQFDLPNDPPKDHSDPYAPLTKIGVLLTRGSIYRQLKEYDKAIDDYTEIFKLNPNHVQAYNNRGNVYALKGLQEEAINDYDEAIKLDPKYPEAYNNRANQKAMKREYDVAIKDYTMALDLNFSQSATTYLLRGGIYETKEMFSNALSDYSKAIDLDEKDTDAYFIRGSLYLKIGQNDNAVKDFNITLGLNPKIGGIPNIHEMAKKMRKKAIEEKRNK